MFQNIWNTVFVATYYQIEAEKISTKQSDKKVIIVLLIVTLSLVFIQYFGSLNFLIEALNNLHLNKLSTKIAELGHFFPNNRLFHLSYWVFILIMFYFVIPVIVIKLFFGDKIGNYGLSPKGMLKSYKIYLLFFTFMIPLILMVSTTESFQHKYPFYNPLKTRLWPNFVYWQCIYFLQFFALEFFFRGFMLHGIKKRFGFYSIFVMMIPYCMIHFQKPMPETIGAIFAGIILGALSLKSRSIWLGVMIHYSVAITMDIAALYQKGYFD